MVAGLVLSVGLGSRRSPPGPATRPIPNPIACENSRAWKSRQRMGHQRRRRSKHPGLSPPTSASTGQTVQFKVDTTATNYRLDIYRMGYYGGMGARKVATVTPVWPHLPQTQPACLSDAVDRAGRLRQLGRLGIVGGAGQRHSGIYFAKLVRDGQRRAPATSSSSCATTAALGSAVPDLRHDLAGLQQLRRQQPLRRRSPAGRAYKVSYNRPFNTRGDGSPQDWVFNAEYPMVRWLEANGYDVSYTTGVDTRPPRRRDPRAQGLPVGRPRRVLVGRAARQRRSRARRRRPPRVLQRQRGVLEDAMGEQHRRLGHAVSHAGLLQGDARQREDRSAADVWTGTWRDPRFSPPADGGRPENALTGTIFTVNRRGHDQRFEVPGELTARLRFWRNTTIATLAAGQTATLPTARWATSGTRISTTDSGRPA